MLHLVCMVLRHASTETTNHLLKLQSQFLQHTHKGGDNKLQQMRPHRWFQGQTFCHTFLMYHKMHHVSLVILCQKLLKIKNNLVWTNFQWLTIQSTTFFEILMTHVPKMPILWQILTKGTKNRQAVSIVVFLLEDFSWLDHIIPHLWYCIFTTPSMFNYNTQQHTKNIDWYHLNHGQNLSTNTAFFFSSPQK